MTDADTEPWKLAEHVINNSLDDWWSAPQVPRLSSLPRQIADALRRAELLNEEGQ